MIRLFLCSAITLMVVIGTVVFPSESPDRALTGIERCVATIGSIEFCNELVGPKM